MVAVHDLTPIATRFALPVADHLPISSCMNKTVIYSAAFAGGLGVATVAVDGYAKALDTMHKDGQTFVLQTAVSSSAAWTTSGVQNMITGDVFEVVEPEPRGRHGVR